MKILLASQNQGKLKEFQAVLGDLNVEWLLPTEVGLGNDFDPPEVGKTFQEVALHKAQAYAQVIGLTVVADDSGLEVTALQNQPGVKSKRFVEGSDHDRNQEILRRLSGQTDRSARFKTVLCLLNPQTDQTEYFEGVVEGQIADQERGSEGFGYDPIFIPKGYDQTFAELGPEIKNQVSHRAQALEKLKSYLMSHSSDNTL